jgi:hypothetical protein
MAMYVLDRTPTRFPLRRARSGATRLRPSALIVATVIGDTSRLEIEADQGGIVEHLA